MSPDKSEIRRFGVDHTAEYVPPKWMRRTFESFTPALHSFFKALKQAQMKNRQITHSFHKLLCVLHKKTIQIEIC